MRKQSILALAVLALPASASAEDTRIHAAAGAGHAVGAPQGRELGAGGGGGAALELAVSRAFGLQAEASFFVLAKERAPLDAAVASRSTGSAFLGTVGVRFHPFGASGVWADANAGVAQTGVVLRPAFDTHLGWQGRFTRDGRWAAGPFVGYMHVLDSTSELRPDDARVLMAGLSVSFGAPDPAPSRPLPRVEPPPPPSQPVTAFEDIRPAAALECDEGSEATPDGGCVALAKIAIVDDRIVLGDVIHFDFDSPRIHVMSRDLVRRVARFILDHPEVVHVTIEGHADARGTEAYNKRLSEERAESTRELLVEFGVPAERIATVAHGKSRLKIPTPKPERQNRRVEFIVDTHSVTAPLASTSPNRGTP